MSFREPSRARIAVAVVLAALVCATPVAAATAPVAQTGTDVRIGATIVVDEGETVDGLEAIGGTILVEGTVTGDVEAVGGDVRIDGDVQGDVDAVGGTVTIGGDVGGDVGTAAGSLEILEGATVDGTLSAGAATVTIDGTVVGDASVGAETIRLGDNAALEGDLRYGGSLEGNTDAVAGEIERDSSIGVGSDLAPTVEPLASWVFALYAFALNLLLGAVLLALFPRFSAGVADRVASNPVRTGLVGLGVLVGVPILLVATAITVIGIPLTIVGTFAFLLVIWIGIVYGRFAVAAALLSLAGVENRWLALVVGLLGGAVLGQVPYVGDPLNLLIFLLGLGALASTLYGPRRTARERGQAEPEPGYEGDVGSDEPATD
ncbi:protein CcmA, bactofilin family [Halobiforma haloterrestris]|uniref:Protein CcmA, bactofilin family n=1 Tax=Natronobacterium haloterrestre TaxID=148448 RepID=A0A1I1HLD6_NATHA|nr:polymer-forming cytoskeletal protein [Halobiforma haloterrestris]SFC24565.1 protein CcmA, bactofilin family [Halobiforma haloterrestris]